MKNSTKHKKRLVVSMLAIVATIPGWTAARADTQSVSQGTVAVAPSTNSTTGMTLTGVDPEIAKAHGISVKDGPDGVTVTLPDGTVRTLRSVHVAADSTPIDAKSGRQLSQVMQSDLTAALAAGVRPSNTVFGDCGYSDYYTYQSGTGPFLAAYMHWSINQQATGYYWQHADSAGGAMEGPYAGSGSLFFRTDWQHTDTNLVGHRNSWYYGVPFYAAYLWWGGICTSSTGLYSWAYVS